jgi:hypothetical protein
MAKSKLRQLVRLPWAADVRGGVKIFRCGTSTTKVAAAAGVTAKRCCAARNAGLPAGPANTSARNDPGEEKLPAAGSTTCGRGRKRFSINNSTTINFREWLFRKREGE